MLTPDYSKVVCALSLDDIPNLKKILEITLKHTGLQPTQRLELFARLCGYRTMASLNADLKAKSDQKLSCLMLYEKYPSNDAFIQGLPGKTRMALAKLDKIGILNLVAAGLTETWHPVFGDIGVDPDTTIESLTQLALKLRENKKAISEFSLGKYERQITSAASVLVLSPNNLDAIRQGVSSLMGGPKILPSRGFAFVKITELNQGVFNYPEDDDIVVLHDSDEIFEFLNGNLPIFFEIEDRDHLRMVLKTPRSSILQTAQTLKETALYIDEEEDGSIFTVGYKGATNCDMPKNFGEVDHRFAMRWLADIATVVHSFGQETSKIAAGC